MVTLRSATTTIAQALHLRELGLSVIPIHSPGMPLPPKTEEEDSGKIPLILWKQFQERLPTEEEVRSWWSRWPQANVGVVTGAVSGVVVLDVDGPDGRMSLKRMNRIPVTWRAITGRVDGGEQIWFRHTGGMLPNFSKRLPGLDFKGDGGYVVAPGSRHRSGALYAWAISPEDVDLADPPAWLLQLIQQPVQARDDHGRGEARDWLNVLRGVALGERHVVATRIAGHYLGIGRKPEEVEALLIGFGAQCRPPHAPDDMRRIVRDLAEKDASKLTVTELGDDQPEPVPEALTLPEAAWRGPFAEYRAAMEGTSEAPDSAHFSTLWAHAAIRLRRCVWIHYTYAHYPNVYLVNFGLTGDSKTSAARQGSRLLPDNGRVKVLRGVGSAEALADWMERPEEGPLVSHLITLEELSTVLIRGGWEGSTLLNFLTEAFDAPPVYEIPYRKKPVRVVEPTPTLLAGTTPEWFWKSMREVDFHGGFGNRLFFLSGTPKPPIPMPAKPDAGLLQRVQDALDGLDDVPPSEMTLTPGALALWEDFYVAWKETAAAFDPLTVAATKRIPAYALKVGLVYAGFEQTAPAITEEQIAAAVQVARYGVLCVERLIQSRRQLSVRGRCEEAFCRVLERADLPVWRVHQRIGGRFTAEDVARALRGLMAAGMVIQIGKTNRGEPVYGLRGRKREA